MINNLFWFLLGAILGVVVFYITSHYPKYTIDPNVCVNIVIALAALLATFLTSKQIDIQRQDRKWDILKSILFELRQLVTEAIEENESFLEFCYSGGSSGGNQEVSPPSDDCLDQKIATILSAYSPILDEELRNRINQHKTLNKELRSQFNNDELGNFDIVNAHEKLLESSKKLNRALSMTIQKNAGV